MGEYEHSLDAKGRLIMPSKLRQDIGEKFVITKGLDGCLFAFSHEEWLNFETKLKSLPLSDKNARNFVRFFLSGATECEIDKQGRFLIPNNLRTAAELEKEAVIIGVGTRLEIWNKENWEKCDENISAEDIAENMTMLGIQLAKVYIKNTNDKFTKEKLAKDNYTKDKIQKINLQKKVKKQKKNIQKIKITEEYQKTKV